MWEVRCFEEVRAALALAVLWVHLARKHVHLLSFDYLVVGGLVP